MNKKITRSQFIGSSIGLTVLSSSKLFGSSLDSLMEPYREAFSRNAEMQSSYDTALNILKPTKAQLEHGLELHKNSLVFDTYGFQPTAALDGAAIADAINDKASPLEIQDLSEEMRMTRFINIEKERKEYENAWLASGVTCVFQNAGEEGNAIERLLKRLARFTYSTDMMKNFISKAVTPEDIIKAKSDNKRVLYFSGNGVPLPQDWVNVEEELRFIRIFYQLGIRMMHLTYNRRNMIGDGCGEPANGGLSDFGRSVVKEMNRVGVIVDIAHSGWQTSLEAAKISDKPAVASHSCAASVNKVIRSKPDEVIKALADSGGFIGICCIPRFLGGTGDIAALMKHIDYVVKKFGADYVTIGTDHGHSSKFNAEENKIISERSKRTPSRTRWEALWPDEGPFTTKAEMQTSMAWTNWPLFTVGLVQLGYSDHDIQKIIGLNAIRVAEKVFKS
ncbi:MAG: membrane dipeptidase [Prolixibacteraceae bacterium]|jgi:membrane dipeptidase|nr:membrane dipeptidase [Prolixibacteraceae bacterium]MDD4755889.1 membrane dipeptidase [Prolixibacteraceae bacterium]